MYLLTVRGTTDLKIYKCEKYILECVYKHVKTHLRNYRNIIDMTFCLKKEDAVVRVKHVYSEIIE